MKGRAARVLHMYGDALCQKWNRNAHINEGFSLTRVRALPGYEETAVPCGSSILEEEEEGEDDKRAEVGQSNDDHGHGQGERIASDVQDNPTLVIPACDLDEAAASNDTTTNEGVAQDGPNEILVNLSEDEMDLLLETLLLRALFYIVKDKHTPFLVSSLWSLLLRYVVIMCE